MTGGWKAKRFWSAVSVGEVDGGYGVMLDARRVMTPGKIPMTIPSRAMAEARGGYRFSSGPSRWRPMFYFRAWIRNRLFCRISKRGKSIRC